METLLTAVIPLNAHERVANILLDIREIKSYRRFELPHFARTS
jgi:hypothetical protein